MVFRKDWRLTSYLWGHRLIHESLVPEVHVVFEETCNIPKYASPIIFRLLQTIYVKCCVWLKRRVMLSLYHTAFHIQATCGIHYSSRMHLARASGNINTGSGSQWILMTTHPEWLGDRNLDSGVKNRCIIQYSICNSTFRYYVGVWLMSSSTYCKLENTLIKGLTHLKYLKHK